MKVKIKLLCDTNQMAYGSSSALLAILQHLSSYNTALAWEVTNEILSSSKLIDKTVKINNKENDLVRENIDLNQFDAVLVISNLTNINWYLDFGIPVFYVDLHHWYPSLKTHRVWFEAKKCFVERFFTKTKLQLNNAIEVGPIITLRKKEKTIKKQILVNIGGGQNRWIQPGKNTNYLQIVLDILNELKDLFTNYKIIIAAGKESVKSIIKKLNHQNFFVATFSQDEYLDILLESEYLITSPGLNSVFEGLYSSKKIVFLPPQNASQIIQLKYYEQAGLVTNGLNLSEYFPLSSLNNGFDEHNLTIEVLNALSKLENQHDIMNNIINHIRNQINKISDPLYFEKQEILKQFLGTPGAETIAKHLLLNLTNQIKVHC